jgi:heme/copper-type cytochrome/quinol oxidase subunit 2
LTISVTSGGIICMVIVGILAIFMVKFRKYDVQTNEFAVAQRQKREKAASEGENPENLEN